MQKFKQTSIKLFYPLLYLTLFSIPFQIRKVLIPVFENGYFHETLSISFYFTDILVVFCIAIGSFLFWDEIKRHLRKLPPSSPSCRERIIKNSLFWLGLFVLWQTAALFYANNIGISLFRIAKIIEMALFGLILYFVCRDAIIRVSTMLWAIALSGTIQSLWGILQFLGQKSLGLAFLKESIISPSIAGTAKIIIGGQKYIRAYGGLPHPNVLAGFLLVSILCTMILICRDEALPRLYNQKNSRLTLLYSSVYTKLTLLLIQLVGFALAASFSAMLGLILGVGIILVNGYIWMRRDVAMQRLYNKENSRLTLLYSSVYYKVTLVFGILIFFSLLGGMIFLRKGDLFKLDSASIGERISQYKDAWNITSKNKNWIWGVGSGNYVDYLCRDAINLQGRDAINRVSTSKKMPWEKQPAHSVFALILAENGAIGLLLFCIFFVFLLVQFPFIAILIPIMLFDYYLYTMQQGILIFVLLAAISYTIQYLKAK